MSAQPPRQFDDLPRSLADLADSLGLPVALALIDHFGGQDVKFPKNPRPDHPVIKALGESDGRAVCRYMAGGAMYVPKSTGGRWRRVQEMAAKGMGQGEVARLLGLSQRHVRRLANEGPRTAPRDPRQPSLFGDD